ncbi:50S ribosomal protein L6 [Calditrichota bacterium]
MSRVGKEPIKVPDGVDVKIDGSNVVVKGKLGELMRDLPVGISVTLTDGLIQVSRGDDSKVQRALHGLSRALLNNMVQGVSAGFAKDLEIVGVGYRCEQRGKAIQFAVGYSHRVHFLPPDGITLQVLEPNKCRVSGVDKEMVGEVAAKIRSIRPPEPYKGKGIKYAGEHIVRKAGKTAGA